jgi:hypothetical protein
MQLAHQPGQQRRQEREVKKTVAFCTVLDHVADRIAKLHQGIQIGQGTRHATPQRRFPHGRASPYDGHCDAAAQCQLRDGVHR